MTITLRLLGGVRLEDASGPLTGEPAQRHRVALLAVLALAKGHRMPREKVMALLWPESSPDNARRLLNMSIYVLRKALGAQALRSEANEIQLDPAHVSCDALRFRDAEARGEFGVATGLYAGPFLDGFFLDGAEEFERWQEGERARIASAFAAALEQHAERLEQAGSEAEALTCWQRLAAENPANAKATLRLMQSLEGAGDRAGALRAAEIHAEVLRDEYEAEPDPTVAELAARIRDRPARVAGVTAVKSDRAGSQRQRPGRLVWALGGAMVAIVAIAVAALAPRGRALPAPGSVAVLPFTNLDPDGEHPYLGEGLAEELLNDLARLPWLRVAARSSAVQLHEAGASVQSIGRQLNVAAVVRGSIRTSGDSVRIGVRLIDARNGYLTWSEEYDRRLQNVLTVQNDIARAIASALSSELAAQVPDSLFGSSTSNVEAYQLYLKGRHEWDKRTGTGMRAALEAFQEAVALDPSYAAAYAGLSDTWQLLPDHGTVPARVGLARAKTAALRAIALDSTEASAFASLGAVLDDYDHDWAGAEAAYRRAIELNPSYATARQWLGLHLANQGRYEEALAEVERARRLDPLSSIISTAVGAVRYFAGDYSGAIAEYQAVVEQDPGFAVGLALLGRAQLLAGEVEVAVESLRQAVELSHGDPSQRAVYAAALAAAGRQDEARAIADEILATPDGDYVPWCELASAFIYLGDFDRALRLFERGREELDPAFKHINVEPLYDQLRPDPRFQAFLRNAGF